MSSKIKLKLSARIMRKKPSRRTAATVKKHCRFTSNPALVKDIDYKNTDFLRSFLTERGKILPSRISGNCAKYQRLLAREIRKARTMALLPYTADQV